MRASFLTAASLVALVFLSGSAQAGGVTKQELKAVIWVVENLGLLERLGVKSPVLAEVKLPHAISASGASSNSEMSKLSFRHSSDALAWDDPAKEIFSRSDRGWDADTLLRPNGNTRLTHADVNYLVNFIHASSLSGQVSASTAAAKPSFELLTGKFEVGTLKSFKFIDLKGGEVNLYKLGYKLGVGVGAAMICRKFECYEIATRPILGDTLKEISEISEAAKGIKANSERVEKSKRPSDLLSDSSPD